MCYRCPSVVKASMAQTVNPVLVGSSTPAMTRERCTKKHTFQPKLAFSVACWAILHVQCLDGIDGNGSCSCQEPFKGVACHICVDPSKHGENCDEGNHRLLRGYNRNPVRFCRLGLGFAIFVTTANDGLVSKGHWRNPVCRCIFVPIPWIHCPAIPRPVDWNSFVNVLAGWCMLTNIKMSHYNLISSHLGKYVKGHFVYQSKVTVFLHFRFDIYIYI